MESQKFKIDLTGKRFGYLTVYKFFDSKNGKARWMCLCICNKKTIVFGYNLINGHTKTCGHLRKQFAKIKFTTHGYSIGKEKSLYTTWKSMKQRTKNSKNLHFKYYGGRGILMDPKWMKFENFRDDMEKTYKIHIKKFGKKNTSIERINNNIGYNKNNCKWATRKEQALNKRNNHLLTFHGKTMPLFTWAKEIGLSPHTLWARINNSNWSTKKALTTPIKNKLSTIDKSLSIINN